MVDDISFQADAEFQQGNFEKASELYGRMLTDLEHQDSQECERELSAVLQKLADSHYALNNFEIARQAYARLVPLQPKDVSANERVMALFKLAKCCERCQAQDDAGANFRAAYEATISLSQKHYLRKTVLDGYAHWLRETGGDKELLSRLEEELGIKKEDATVAVEPEVRPDDMKLPTANVRPSGEQEYFVMRSKLEKFKSNKGKDKRKSESHDQGEIEGETEGEGSAADKASKMALKADSKKTIEQEVAERKFLRKKDRADRVQESDQISSRRSLRNTMSSERRPTSEEQPQQSYAEPYQESAQDQVAFAPASIDPAATAMPDVIPLHVDERRAVAELVHGKFVGKTVQRSLREDNTRKKRGVDLTVPAQSTPTVPDNSRSFIQQADAIKKASDEAPASASDLVGLREEGRVEAQIPVSVKVINALRMGAPLVFFCSLIAIIFYGVKSLHLSSAGHTGIPGVAVVGHTFVTADNSVHLAINDRDIDATGIGLTKTAKVRYWNGDLSDEIMLLQGHFKSCKWLKIVPEGLKDEDGTTLYSLDAPERQVIDAMQGLRDQAQNFFAKNNRYPGYSADLTQATYPNPFTKKAEPLSVLTVVDAKVTSADGALDAQLLKGEPFKGENKDPNRLPGAITALSVSGDPQYSEDQNAIVWKTDGFYIHGCDRNGQLISGNAKDRVFLLSMKNGIPKPTQGSNAFYADEYCLSLTDRPREDSILFKYVLIAVVIFGFIFFCVILSISKSGLTSGRRERLPLLDKSSKFVTGNAKGL